MRYAAGEKNEVSSSGVDGYIGEKWKVKREK